MLSVSIKTQKIIMWIPVANVVNFLIWGSNVSSMSNHEKKRGAWICFSTVVLLALIQISIAVLIPRAEHFSEKIVIYFFPVILNWRLIRLQERLQKNTELNLPTSSKSQQYILFAVAGGCIVIASLVGFVLYRTSSKQIEDQNGANNTSLSVLTREDILDREKYAIQNHTRTAYGDSGNMNSQYDDVDVGTISHVFGRISGIYTVHATKTDKQTLSLTITSTLHSGNMELAVLVDGQYYCSVPLNEVMQITLENISGKTVLVRLAGESAKAEISVSRSYA